MKITKNQVLRLLAIVSFFLLIRNLFLLKSVQSMGYVVDIYRSFPLSFYISFIFCYFTSSILILYKHKKLGTLTLCLNHFEILIIPYMLGYYSMGRADDMMYIGEYLQIANLGYFSTWDIYPASHTIGAFMLLMSNIEAHYVSFIIPIVFSFIFIIGMNLFSRKLISDSFVRSLVLISSFILYLGVYNFLNVPHSLFFAYMPLYLYIIQKHIATYKNTSLAVIFVLITLIIPISHPFIVFFVTSIFLFFLLPEIISNFTLYKINIPRIKVSSYLLLIISFLCWFSYSKALNYRLKQYYWAYIDKITEPVFFETTAKLSRIHLKFFDYLQLIGFFYGRYAIPIIFIFISFVLVYHYRKSLNENTRNEYTYLLLLYFTFALLQFILYFNPFISHQPDRIANLNFVVYSQVPLFSYALYFIFFKNSIKFRKILQVCAILTFIWSLSLFGCFDSPNTYRTNVALTYNEVEGMSWLYQVKDNSSVSAPISQIERFRQIFGDYSKPDTIIPLTDHFGYVNKSDTFGNINLNESKAYIVILTIDELLYQEVPGYMTVGRYTSSDFIRFRKDISLNKIYDSLNIEIFKSV